MMYYIEIDKVTGSKSIIYLSGNIMISFTENPENTDYQEYLKWLEEGNEPEIWDNGV